MAAIAALNEDFTGGAAGVTISATNTIFDRLTGTGASTFIVDPYDVTRNMMSVNLLGNSRSHEMDFAAVPLVWFRFDVDLATPLDATTAILNGFATSTALITEKIFDVQQVAASRTLRLRDVNTTVWTSTALAASEKHRIYTMVKLGATPSARRLRIMIYSGGDLTTLTQDSGEILASANLNDIAHLRTGTISASTGVVRLGRFRADDAVQPVPASSGTVNLGADQTVSPGATVTVTAIVTGTGTLTFTQTSGPAVTLTGTGTTRTFTMPSVPAGSSVILESAYGGSTDSVTYTALPFAGATVGMGPDQNNVEAGTTVTLTATTTGTGTLVFTQTAGTVVTLSGTGSSRTFTAPANNGSTLTFQAAYGGVTDAVNVVVLPHNHYTRRNNVWVGRFRTVVR